MRRTILRPEGADPAVPHRAAPLVIASTPSRRSCQYDSGSTAPPEAATHSDNRDRLGAGSLHCVELGLHLLQRKQGLLDGSQGLGAGFFIHAHAFSHSQFQSLRHFLGPPASPRVSLRRRHPKLREIRHASRFLFTRSALLRRGGRGANCRSKRNLHLFRQERSQGGDAGISEDQCRRESDAEADNSPISKFECHQGIQTEAGERRAAIDLIGRHSQHLCDDLAEHLLKQALAQCRRSFL